MPTVTDNAPVSCRQQEAVRRLEVESKRRFPELFLADGPAGNWLICRRFSVPLAQRGRHETDSCGLGGEDY